MKELMVFRGLNQISFLVAFLMILFCFFDKPVWCESEIPLIPLPGDSPTNQGKANDPEVIIPLPGEENDTVIPLPKEPPSTFTEVLPTNPSPGQNTPIIEIPSKNDSDGSITITPGMPNEDPSSANISGSASQTIQPKGNESPQVFPKDTSSAIFMIMKTWECQDYDGRTFVEHAGKVYSEESEDKFLIEGLSNLPPFKITLKEDDITLDELLDILSGKHGFDWGVDLVNKTIHLYSKKPQNSGSKQ